VRKDVASKRKKNVNEGREAREASNFAHWNGRLVTVDLCGLVGIGHAYPATETIRVLRISASYPAKAPGAWTYG